MLQLAAGAQQGVLDVLGQEAGAARRGGPAPTSVSLADQRPGKHPERPGRRAEPPAGLPVEQAVHASEDPVGLVKPPPDGQLQLGTRAASRLHAVWLVTATISRSSSPASTGVIDVATFLNALAQAGYDGPVRAEPFNRPLNELDNDAACTAVMQSLRKAFEAAAAKA